MTQPYVWSERNEPNATGLKDCTYAAGLTAMVYSGWKDFPKGIYSVAEREALERSDDQPNETGASLPDLKTAIKRRYGKDVGTIRGIAALAGQLDVRSGLVVQGYLKNFPAGHRLRRFQPSFTGGHAIFVYFGSDRKYHWYDPLNKMKAPGDIVTKADVLTFAKGLGSFITFKPDQWLPAPVVVPPPPVKTYTQDEWDTLNLRVTALNTENSSLRNLVAVAEKKIAAAKIALG